MVLTITPALEGLKKDWREASENLGASSWQYWRDIALPILWPSILGATLLLFGSAFGAFATAQALTGGSIYLVTILIGQQIRGDVLNNPNQGYALSLGMVVVMAFTILAYTVLQRQTARWLKS
jgi:putative spermidine/putrescine transport system permease protein